MGVISLIDNEVPPKQEVIQSTQLVEIPCITSLPRSDTTPLDFRVDKTEVHVDPTQVYLYLKCKIKTEGDLPYCANNLAYAIWQNVEMYINDEKVTQEQTLYPWMSYLMCLTRFSKQYRDTVMRHSCVWIEDKYGTMDTDRGQNDSIKERQKMLHGEFELYSRILLDFVHLPRLLPAQTEVTFRFVPSRPATYLIGPGTPILEIRDARLYVSKVKLATTLPKQMVYPVSRYSGKTRLINAGEQNVDWNAFTGRRPRRLYVMQILQDAYNGNYKMNPFNLQTFKLKGIQVHFNDTSLPVNVATPFGKNNTVRCFLNTVKAIDSPLAWSIDLWAYDSGYFVYAVDLTKDHSANSNYRSSENSGSIRVKLDYESPLEKPVVLICFAEYDDTLTIDQYGKPSWT